MAATVKRLSTSRNAPAVRELIEQVLRMRSDMKSFSSTARRALEDGDGILRETLREHPYRTIAVAAGIGYVLGGGLPISLIRTALAIGGRFAIERAILELVRPGATTSD
ncbi:MAG: hypothetical protein AB7V27_05460 [Candidatus Binatia bacterium]